MTESQVYWWLMMDGIKCVSVIAAIVITAIGGIFILSVTEKVIDGDTGKLALLVWLLSPVILFFVMVAVLVPTTKQLALIKVLPQIANSEISKELPEDLKDMYQMAKEYMKEKLQPESK